jgi:hypothetical protein
MCTNDIKANPEGYQSPDQLGMFYKEVWILTKDNIKLYGWFIYHEAYENKSYPTIIYFHENAGSNILFI